MARNRIIDIEQIEPGEEFVEAINRKVGACDIAIVLLGTDWLGAADASGKRRLDDSEDFVRMEIIAALERKIRVIPVLVGGARMPRKQDLPEALAPLSRRNAIELSKTRFHFDVSRLIEAIEKPRTFPEKKTEPLPGPVALVAEPASPEKSDIRIAYLMMGTAWRLKFGVCFAPSRRIKRQHCYRDDRRESDSQRKRRGKPHLSAAMYSIRPAF